MHGLSLANIDLEEPQCVGLTVQALKLYMSYGYNPHPTLMSQDSAPDSRSIEGFPHDKYALAAVSVQKTFELFASTLSTISLAVGPSRSLAIR